MQFPSNSVSDTFIFADQLREVLHSVRDGDVLPRKRNLDSAHGCRSWVPRFSKSSTAVGVQEDGLIVEWRSWLTCLKQSEAYLVERQLQLQSHNYILS